MIRMKIYIYIYSYVPTINCTCTSVKKALSLPLKEASLSRTIPRKVRISLILTEIRADHSSYNRARNRRKDLRCLIIRILLLI